MFLFEKSLVDFLLSAKETTFEYTVGLKVYTKFTLLLSMSTLDLHWAYTYSTPGLH